MAVAPPKNDFDGSRPPAVGFVAPKGLVLNKDEPSGCAAAGVAPNRP